MPHPVVVLGGSKRLEPLGSWQRFMKRRAILDPTTVINAKPAKAPKTS
jgi:hypothetical protein